MENEISKVRIIVVTHKSYQMPEDRMYLPLYVGAQSRSNEEKPVLNREYAEDDKGENISVLNPYFCELTGLYWAWKNLDAQYIGLVHYRRHFSMGKRAGFENILTYKELEPYLGDIKVFVPKKRRYYIETLYSHYGHTHYVEHLDETRKIIAERYPDFIQSYDRVMNRSYGYMFNMMIMQKDLLNRYCGWLFDILFMLQDRIDTEGFSAFSKRCYGRVSEIIFNVWLDRQIEAGEIKEKQVMEIPWIYLEKSKWRKKGMAFLKAKFCHIKYEESF